MNERRRLSGVVLSNHMEKTVVVQIGRTYRHPVYKKVVHARHRVKAHDELGCQIGDTVLLVESRPLSREKRWVVEAIEKRSGELLEEAQVAAEVRPTESGAEYVPAEPVAPEGTAEESS
jgi:small subunit ribosomal protein S17